jgi:serine/threonine-protein kinase
LAHPQQQGPDPFLGRVIDDRYQILQRVGEGGMGVVYKAKQVSIDRVIALKMLNQQMAQDPQWVKRFYNEAKACSRLQHPNTIRMFDFGQTREGRLFMTMEFLDGQPLRQAIAQGSPMSSTRVLKILIQCCASLAEAHSIGIIHRDIKPDNVFLLNMAGSPDFVKLLDFSVAKLLQDDKMRTQAGVVFGTPQYMSPEQGRGLPLDARSDLYALGILAFEMLTGHTPFNDENPMHVLQMHLRSPVPQLPGNGPQAMQQILFRALEKEPGRRCQSAGEMMQMCQQAFTSLGASSAGISAPPPQQAAPAAQKTMIAGMAPPSVGQFGGAASSANQKTMMADLGGAAGFKAPAEVATVVAPQDGPKPNKTIMLQDSEGLISMAEDASVEAIPQASVGDLTGVTAKGGASGLFWAVCLITGVGVGVLAYVIVLQLS